MSKLQVLAVLLLTAVTSTLATAALLSRPARAELPPAAPITIVCTSKLKMDLKLDKSAADPTARWMNEQAAAGKTHFLSAPTVVQGEEAICAW